jgi:two-component system phosphate regulon sensor histidine kinase PhoR
VFEDKGYFTMKTHLFYKVFATYLIIVALALAIVGILSYQQLKAKMLVRIETELMNYTTMIDITSSVPEIEEKIGKLAAISNARVTLIDANGKVVADSEVPVEEMDNHLDRAEIQEARVKGKGIATRFSHTLGIDTLYVAIPIKGEYGISSYIRLARPLLEVKASINKLISLILQSFILIGALSFLIAFIFTSRLVSPVQEMEEYTRKLREEDVTQTLLVSANDERGRLAQNINYLVSDLREKIRFSNEEKGKLKAAFASMSDGVLILDSEDRIEALNNAFMSIFGTLYGDIIGKTPLEAFRNIELQNAIDHFRNTKDVVSREMNLGIENPVILDVTISQIQGLPKDEEKTMIVLHDVTRLKKLEKMRVDFVANVTHEIKTPLSAILGFVETLREGAIDNRETSMKFLGIIDEHAQRLNRLVDDLLIISDIELGEKRLFFESVPVEEAIKSALSITEPKAAKKGITVEKDIPEEMNPVIGDRDSLEQVFLNVLDNAVKFTPEAGTISVSAVKDEEDRLAVRITDTGTGIPKDEIPRLGERFYRVDKTRSRELGGTGLGLSIVKHLMNAHKGTIEIESQPGRGTTVTLRFPLFK